jgi:hypothetical protein
VLAFELAVSLLFRLGLLQRGKLCLGEHEAILAAFRLQRLQALLHRLQIVPQPDATHACWRAYH